MAPTPQWANRTDNHFGTCPNRCSMEVTVPSGLLLRVDRPVILCSSLLTLIVLAVLVTRKSLKKMNEKTKKMNEKTKKMGKKKKKRSLFACKQRETALRSMSF